MDPSTPIIERLLRVIDEGRRTSTYKLALLAALIDLAASRPGVSTVPTRVLAERVLESYFDQCRPFTGADGSRHDLKQITAQASALVDTARDLRSLADRERLGTLSGVQATVPDEYASAVDAVEATLVRYPILRLQVVGSSEVPFLYDADWNESTSVAALRRIGLDRIQLRDGVADQLVRFGPLLRPLIELHWRNDVARWSGVATEDQLLDAHLFGVDRTAMRPKTKDALVEVQDGRCFYCREPLGQRVEIDHFIAWSRWPNNAIENLVAADRCNGSKSDHLAAHEHARRWNDHVRNHGSDLHAIAIDTKWDSNPERSRGLAVSTYSNIAAGTPLWFHGRTFRIEGPLDL